MIKIENVDTVQELITKEISYESLAERIEVIDRITKYSEKSFEYQQFVYDVFEALKLDQAIIGELNANMRVFFGPLFMQQKITVTLLEKHVQQLKNCNIIAGEFTTINCQRLWNLTGKFIYDWCDLTELQNQLMDDGELLPHKMTYHILEYLILALKTKNPDITAEFLTQHIDTIDAIVTRAHMNLMSVIMGKELKFDKCQRNNPDVIDENCLLIKALLKKHGYQRKYQHISLWDDFYILH